ncbi:MAG: long-chain fatty acid--CoA ligase [Deltaproteobacteria bacterium]|nr:long-chain fatty acid--CoA ligase [Deltaproteobacteria bacterium]
MFQKRCEVSGPALAARQKQGGVWRDTTWRDYHAEVERVAFGLLALGLAKGDAVAVLGETCHTWCLADLGTMLAGGVNVGIYATNTAKQCAYILKDSRARVAFVQGRDQLAKIVAEFREQSAEKPVASSRERNGEPDGHGGRTLPLPDLRTVIVWGEKLNGEAPTEFAITFDELLRRGDAHRSAHPNAIDERQDEVEPNDTALLIYTSGTTGPPKGAVLSHANVLSFQRAGVGIFDFRPDDMSFVFLPMCHAAEHVVGFYGRIFHGIAGTFATSLETVITEVKDVRPTLFGSVPRIFEKVYAKVNTEVEKGSPVKRAIFRWAVDVGRRVKAKERAREWVPPHLAVQHRVADKLVLRKVREAFGGRVRAFISGAAPISVDILEFFHACGMLVLEAYGLTEVSAVCTGNKIDDYRFGSVGKPIPGVDVRIAPDGEIIVKGPTVFSGYLNLKEATAEAIDGDGWFHTGDIGRFDSDGYLYITDRKKNLIVTAGGKNVAPANIENLVKADPIISQVIVHGDRRNFLTALVTVDKDEAARFAAANGFAAGDMSHPKMRERVQKAIDAANAELARYEQVRKFVILQDDLSQESGELTPTLKVKRKVVEEKYRAVLDRMYAD